MNTQSAGCKSDMIVSFIVDNNLDLVVITESWLTEDDQITSIQAKPMKDTVKPKSCELFEAHVSYGKRTVSLVVVYRSQ